MKQRLSDEFLRQRDPYHFASIAAARDRSARTAARRARTQRRRRGLLWAATMILAPAVALTVVAIEDETTREAWSAVGTTAALVAAVAASVYVTRAVEAARRPR